jgi:hypothetical protein
MAEIDSIISMVKNSSETTDSACLKIIDTPDLKLREANIENAEVSHSKKYAMQPVENWRLSKSVGVPLDNTNNIIRANCFRLSPKDLPPKIFHYFASIYRFSRDGEIEKDDLTKEKDGNLCVGIVKQAIDKNPEWKIAEEGNKVIGLAYDGRSALYTTGPLPFGKDYQCELHWPINSPTQYLLLLSFANEINIPQSHGKKTTFEYLHNLF